MAEGWMKPILDDEPLICSKPINGTLFDISAAAKKNAGNQLRHDLNPKYSKHRNWKCGSCGFRTNFPMNILCYKCNEPKKGDGRSQNNPPPSNTFASLFPKGSPDPDPYANRSVILSEEGFHVEEKPKRSRREALRQEALKRETTRLGSIKIQSNAEAEESNLDQFHENFRKNDFTKKQPPYNNNVTECSNKVDNDTVEYDADSEDSFYSVRSSFSYKKYDDDDGGQEVSSDDPMILLENLGENIKTLSGNSDQEKNLKIVTQLLLETDYKAQSLKLVSNYGIYSICSKILEQHHSGPILVKYLQFFTKVIQTALQEEPKKYAIEQIISVKVDMFELFGRFLSLLEHFMPRRLSDSPRNDVTDKELIETLLQIIKALALKDCIQNLFNLRSFRFYNFIHEWGQFNPGKKWNLVVRDIKLTISKYFYENNFNNGKKPLRMLMDIFVADICIKYLRLPKHNQSEDHLYLLYHILSYMPLTNVRSVFKANNLDLLIQMIEKELKASQKDELALIARKILDFPNSNFLSGKQI